MRTMLSGIAVLALACASASGAVGQTTMHPAPLKTMAPRPLTSPMKSMTGGTMSTATAGGHAANTNCTSATNFVVWWVPSRKTYYRKGQAGFGKGIGQMVCRRTAIAHHARLATGAMSTMSTMSSKSTMSTKTTHTTRPATSPGGMMMGSPMPATTGPAANPSATPATEPGGPNTPPTPAGSPVPGTGASPMPGMSALPAASPAPAAT